MNANSENFRLNGPIPRKIQLQKLVYFKKK